MRALSDDEIQTLLTTFGGTYNKRDLAIFCLCISTGFRIKESLSLQIKDVYNIEKQKLLPTIHVQKQNMKKKQSRPPVMYSPSICKYLLDWIAELGSSIKPEDPLFESQKLKDGKKHAITVRSAIRIFKSAYEKAGIVDMQNVSTHSCRKTFASKVYAATGKDLLKTQKAMGHKSIDSTTKYLTTCTNEINDITSGLNIL